MKLYGYELLYRHSEVNNYDCSDGNKASSDVMVNSFHLIGIDNITGGKKAFINFTDQLIKEEIATLFPSKDLVIEILETVQPCTDIILSCSNLKNKGYTIALDDFVFSEQYLPLIAMADIIKIDFLNTPPHIRETLVKSLKNRKIKFLAEKIETHEDFEQAKKWGYSLFQGYFFSKPIIMSVHDVSPSKLNYLQLIQKTNAAEFDFEHIADIVSRDLSLSYKLLRMVNSAAFGFRSRIKSVRQALVLLGSDEIKKWVSLIAIRGIGEDQPEEIITTSLVRARFLEQLSVAFHKSINHDECFLTGLFSTLDVLMNRPMPEILKEIAITDDIIEALTHNSGRMGHAYQLILAYEKADWDTVTQMCSALEFDCGQVTDIYLEALNWSHQLETEIHLHE
jgi:EAL and modified HD-GYP domain-containing signal transduction protein